MTITFKIRNFIKIKTMLRLFPLGLCLLFTAPIAEAKQKVTLKFAAGQWPKYTNADGSGAYWDIIRSIFGDDYELELITTPWTRAKNLMNASKVDALMAISAPELGQLIIPHQHLDTEYAIFAMFDRNIHSIRSAQDLDGMTVAGRSQYGFEYFIPKNISYYGVDSIAGTNKLLFKRRVDAVLVSEYNLKKADPTETFDYVEVIPEQKLYIGFHNNVLGKKLRSLFDRKMPALVKSNQIKEYFPSEAEYFHAKLEPLQ